MVKVCGDISTAEVKKTKENAIRHVSKTMVEELCKAGSIDCCKIVSTHHLQVMLFGCSEEADWVPIVDF